MSVHLANLASPNQTDWVRGVLLILLDHLAVRKRGDNKRRLLRVTADTDVDSTRLLGDDAHVVQEWHLQVFPVGR